MGKTSKIRSSQYGSQIRFIFHTCLYLEGEIILFLILTIWDSPSNFAISLLISNFSIVYQLKILMQR